MWRLLTTIFPILNWLTKYNVRENLLNDVVSGITILALHIPQGLAYGRLAGVEPIYGLYVSLFPGIIYSLMGTSRHISIGTYAVVSIACRNVLSNFNQSPIGLYNVSVYSDTDLLLFDGKKLHPMEVLTSLALLVGLIQFIIGLLQLGILSILLRDSVISSFVVGSSMHVFTSQLFALLGIDSTVKNKYPAIPFALIKVGQFFHTNKLIISIFFVELDLSIE